MSNQRENGRSQGGRNDSSNGQGQSDPKEGLWKLFIHQLTDLYYVEKQLIKAIPRMADKAMDQELSEALQDHAQETEQQVERLEEVFDILERTARAKKCEAIDGILDEAKELMDEFKGDPALDAAIVCAAQKVEHYEITTYGSLSAFANELGLDDVVSLLEETLEEEKHADERLSQLAESAVNMHAKSGEDEDESRGSSDDEDEDEDGADGKGRSQQGGRNGVRSMVH